MEQVLRSDTRTPHQDAALAKPSPYEPAPVLCRLPVPRLSSGSPVLEQTGPSKGDALETPDDIELLRRVRCGDSEAFGILYSRYAGLAMAWCRRWCHDPSAAEDLRSEAFTRLLSAIRNGHGPNSALLPYLRATIQNLSNAWCARDVLSRTVTQVVEHELPESDPMVELAEQSLTLTAYATLSERWRRILEYTVIDGLTPAETAPLLGLDAMAVAALAYRAREGLRQAYLQSHIRRSPFAMCKPFCERLGAYTRGRVGSRERARIHRHLVLCTECARLFAMLRRINKSLAASQSARRRQTSRATAAPDDGPSEPGAEEHEVPFADAVARCRFERQPRHRVHI
jgi:RNA polymerase sigma factor (sigma-70 family)